MEVQTITAAGPFSCKVPLSAGRERYKLDGCLQPQANPRPAPRVPPSPRAFPSFEQPLELLDLTGALTDKMAAAVKRTGAPSLAWCVGRTPLQGEERGSVGDLPDGRLPRSKIVTVGREVSHGL